MERTNTIPRVKITWIRIGRGRSNAHAVNSCPEIHVRKKNTGSAIMKLIIFEKTIEMGRTSRGK